MDAADIARAPCECVHVCVHEFVYLCGARVYVWVRVYVSERVHPKMWWQLFFTTTQQQHCCCCCWISMKWKLRTFDENAFDGNSTAASRSFFVSINVCARVCVWAWYASIATSIVTHRIDGVKKTTTPSTITTTTINTINIQHEQQQQQRKICYFYIYNGWKWRWRWKCFVGKSLVVVSGFMHIFSLSLSLCRTLCIWSGCEGVAWVGGWWTNTHYKHNDTRIYT